MGEQDLASPELFLAELGHGVGWPGGEADHPAVRGGDAEHQALLLRVAVLRPQLGVGQEDAGAGPDRQAGVVHQAGDGVVHRDDVELQRGGDAGLVLLRPVQSHRPGHQHQAVLLAVAPVVDLLKHLRSLSRFGF